MSELQPPEKPGPWVCDTCDQPIEEAATGYVVWRNDDQGCHDFNIIHKITCNDRDRFSQSAALAEFLGPRGLSYCLSFLSLGPVLARTQNVSHTRAADMDEFVDFVRRVQLPHYEQARRLYKDRAVLDQLRDANEIFPYLPGTMKTLTG